MTSLRAVALGVAIAQVDHGVREEGGNNRGAWIKRYLANCDPPLPEGNPWCAAAVQYVADCAARAMHSLNPLDGVRLEAYVQSYYDWAKPLGLLVESDEALPGDLILFNFHGARWDHIGLVLEAPRNGVVRTVEGNTGADGGRDGDGYHFKARTVVPGRTAFIRWAA